MTENEIFRSELTMQRTALVLALHRVDTMLSCLDIGAEKITEMKRKQFNDEEAAKASRSYFAGKADERRSGGDDDVSTQAMFDYLEDEIATISNFNATFFESLRAQWDARGSLSPKQIASLKNMYLKFKEKER